MHRKARNRLVPAVALVPAMVLAFGAASTTPAAATFRPPRHDAHHAMHRAPVPGATWETAAPDSVGLDAAALEKIAATAQAGKSNCLVVVRHGKLAGEWYFNGTGPGTAQDVFSVTKSVASTLVGIAQDERELNVRDRAAKYVPEWRGTPASAVRVRHLLSNTSGRQWSTQIDYSDLISATDRTGFAVGLSQQHRPGQVWAYNNSAIQTLERVLKNATGQDVRSYAQQKLFNPLGMSDTTMTPDPAGNAQTYAGVRTTCRDLARFGLLALRQGHWGKQKVVSRSWFQTATGRSSSSLNAAYGYLWWVNRYGVQAGALTPMDRATAHDPATPRTRLVPTAPEDTFWAIGLGNQIVQVDPGSDTVVVRLGTPEFVPTPPTFGPAQAARVITEAVR